ncbi:YgaP family membrane protein [Aliiroseovarius lamellibrachiae]|uniref:YgaP family membrane protein n=1 Tax=Aliiroseovarius lamellibrachiae TaxID=1924933 RepID=UPI001BE03FB7|nr:DUF2892 domain-containing protein [Aliiroseovarius lamellibrachiae]MBT2130018.1 DUF2892 domain-containing protein [Aliiroseovarius lamellibrachiae]
MTTNVGTFDRILRAALGAVLLYLALFSGLPLFAASFVKYAAVAVGVVMLATSSLKMCPIYSLLGLKTCKTC